MKIIEAMKKVKDNRAKIADLQALIQKNCAHLSHETPGYDNPRKKVEEWLQACLDLSQDCARLLTAISRTNLATSVTIEIGGKAVTKTIAEWIWRRREFAALDTSTYQCLTDKRLQGGNLQQSDGTVRVVSVVRNFDTETRDKKLLEFSSEPRLIDSTLEVINATTDLIEA